MDELAEARTGYVSLRANLGRRDSPKVIIEATKAERTNLCIIMECGYKGECSSREREVKLF